MFGPLFWGGGVQISINPSPFRLPQPLGQGCGQEALVLINIGKGAWKIDLVWVRRGKVFSPPPFLDQKAADKCLIFREPTPFFSEGPLQNPFQTLTVQGGLGLFCLNFAVSMVVRTAVGASSLTADDSSQQGSVTGCLDISGCLHLTTSTSHTQKHIQMQF